ncbi:MAG: adenylate/guanylate cyclase domain-containing protein [Hyphomicrobiales bacterium]|nr:adenylate/guanylate cyclase domain-containing protein [Hyphomicrobiales bacterium]
MDFHIPPIVEIRNWLLNEGWSFADPGDLLRAVCRRLVEGGYPLYRVRLTIRTLHPEFLGVSYTWNRKDDQVEFFEPPHAMAASEAYRRSPFAAIFEGAGGIRRRLDVPDVVFEYPILDDLKAEGATDYVAMPFHFSDGSRHAITIAADRPGGFTTRELQELNSLLEILARPLELHGQRRVARNLLETYLGRHSGQRVLNGQIKRGDGEEIHAVIWFCDLRNSTPLAESMPRRQFLALLDRFFECMAGAVLDHGGEVLRFIGDAVLAIFPMANHHVENPAECPVHRQACETALAAARDAMGRVAELNHERTEAGEAPIGYGIGLHVGDVMYGNIGTPGRLEFSVIGSAANEAARLEGMCKTLGQALLISEDFARILPESWRSLGTHEFRGVKAPKEVFTVADAA